MTRTANVHVENRQGEPKVVHGGPDVSSSGQELHTSFVAQAHSRYDVRRTTGRCEVHRKGRHGRYKELAITDSFQRLSLIGMIDRHGPN